MWALYTTKNSKMPRRIYAKGKDAKSDLFEMKKAGIKGEKMKIRLCDSCNKTIKGKYVKCCESFIENKQQRLNHIGDICLNCWSKLFLKDKIKP